VHIRYSNVFECIRILKLKFDIRIFFEEISRALLCLLCLKSLLSWNRACTVIKKALDFIISWARSTYQIPSSCSSSKTKELDFPVLFLEKYSSSGLMKSSVLLRYWKIIIFELWFLNAWYGDLLFLDFLRTFWDLNSWSSDSMTRSKPFSQWSDWF
jgi:hypothetical protein